MELFKNKLLNDRSVIYLCIVIEGKTMTKAEKTRQLIIEKSAPLFNVKGVSGTAMSDIMEATQLAKGSLYVHFESKEDLACCVVDFSIKTLGDKILAALDRQRTSKSKLLAFADFYHNPLHTPIAGGCPMLNFGTEADDTDQVIREKVNRGIEFMHDLLSGLVEKGIKDGEFKKTWNAREFAIKTYAMIEGGIMMTRVAGNNDIMKVIIRLLKGEIEEESI